jgi:hypothetical protein
MEADAGALEFPFHERVAIEPIGGVKGEEAGHAHDDRSQNLVADVEVVMREAAALVGEDAIVGVWVGYFGMLIRKVRPCSMLLKMK